MNFKSIQFTIGSYFSVHYRSGVLEQTGSLESTIELDRVDILCMFQSLEFPNLGFCKATFPDSR